MEKSKRVLSFVLCAQLAACSLLSVPAAAIEYASADMYSDDGLVPLEPPAMPDFTIDPDHVEDGVMIGGVMIPKNTTEIAVTWDKISYIYDGKLHEYPILYTNPTNPNNPSYDYSVYTNFPKLKSLHFDYPSIDIYQDDPEKVLKTFAELGTIKTLKEFKVNLRILPHNGNIPNTEADGSARVYDVMRRFTGLEKLEMCLFDDTRTTTSISFVSELKKLKELRLSVSGTENTISLSPLSGLSDLTSLELDFAPTSAGDAIGFKNPEALGKLKKLKRFGITDAKLSKKELKIISKMSGLTELDLSCTEISDIGSLKKLTKLKTLYLGGNNITDISALSGMKKLQSLDLRENNISDISVLSGMKKLKKLDLSCNPIGSIKPLSGLTGLTELGLRSEYDYDTQKYIYTYSDLTPLKKLKKLRRLYISGDDRIEKAKKLLPECEVSEN